MMTFNLLGSEFAPRLLDIRPAAMQGIVSTEAADLGWLFSLDRPSGGRRLVCHWRRQPDGRLACTWEPDIVLIPQR
jgi:hypothetical protein